MSVRLSVRLDLCRLWRAQIKHPATPELDRLIAHARLRHAQNGFARELLERELSRFLHPVDSGETGDNRPFTVYEHDRIFDALHVAREAMEGWRVTINRLRPPTGRLSLERLSPR